jgi:hypothetical protein
MIDKHLPELLNAYIQYIKKIDMVNMTLVKKIRQDNFPCHLSENLVKLAIKRWRPSSNVIQTTKYDLMDGDMKYEVKAFSNPTYPCSFGSNGWDSIYFLDATNIRDYHIKVYELPMAHTNPIWENLKVNSYETFKDQCDQKRRPRISFERIYSYLSNFIYLIYDGSTDNLLK